MSLYLESFKQDGSKVKNSIANKSRKKSGWTLYTLKWLVEMFYGRIPYLKKFTFIEYGAYPNSDGEEFLLYMKAMYGDKAKTLLKK